MDNQGYFQIIEARIIKDNCMFDQEYITTGGVYSAPYTVYKHVNLGEVVLATDILKISRSIYGCVMQFTSYK